MAFLVALAVCASLLAGVHGGNCPGLADFAFVEGRDSPAASLALLTGTINDFAAACRADDRCLGFNTAGYLKAAISPPAEWFPFTANTCSGLFLRVDKLGVVGRQGPQGPKANNYSPSTLNFVNAFSFKTNLAARGSAPTPCIVGEIKLTAGKVTGGIKCDGSILSKAQYPELFSMLGKSFGGDGIVNFGIPNLAAIAPDYMTYWICAKGDLPTKA